MRISDWSSDVCSSDLLKCYRNLARAWLCRLPRRLALRVHRRAPRRKFLVREDQVDRAPGNVDLDQVAVLYQPDRPALGRLGRDMADRQARGRSEEQTSEIQSLMRLSYAVFCLKK